MRVHEFSDDPRVRHRAAKIHTWIFAVPGAILATITIMSVIWKTFLASAVIAQVTDAVSADLEDKITAAVQKEITPVNAGLKAIIQDNVNRLRREIAELNRRDRLNELVAGESRLLEDKRIELDGQRDALAAIVAAEQATPAR